MGRVYSVDKYERRSDGQGYWAGLGNHDPPTREGPLDPINLRMEIRALYSERQKRRWRTAARIDGICSGCGRAQSDEFFTPGCETCRKRRERRGRGSNGRG